MEKAYLVVLIKSLESGQSIIPWTPVPILYLKVMVFSRVGYLQNYKEQGSSGQGISVSAND